MKHNKNSTITSIIKTINSPLGFFVLALLIVEGFLGMVLVKSNLNQEQTMRGIYLGAGLFIIVILIVAYLVKNCPRNLIFGEKSLLDFEKEKIKSGVGLEKPEDISPPQE